MPEDSTTPRTALHVVQSEALLDGDPGKNLATFVTTWMEPEARVIIDENLHRNYIDHAEYPRTAEISRRCLRMLRDLFHGDGEPNEPGAACAGSSEAVMLGALAMKWRWKKARKKAGRPDDSPNLVYGADVHVVWDKFCRYFDVEPRKIDVAYAMPPANEDQRLIRILVKINETRELADALADDIRDSVRDLRKGAAGEAVKRPVHRGHGY